MKRFYSPRKASPPCKRARGFGRGRTLAYEWLEDRSLMAAGMLDPTFGVDGKVITDLGGFDADVAKSVAVQSDGKIVVAGFTSIDGVNDFALARYNVDGTLDASFDGDGIVFTDFSGRYDSATDLAIQSDGKIVVAGFTSIDSKFDFALAHYNVDGTLDASFDGDGKVITDFSGSDDVVGEDGIVLQSDGKILVAGRSGNGSNSDFAVVRYNADGTLDASFDGDGKVTTDFGGRGSQGDGGVSVAQQSDGKILVAGYSDKGNFNFGLAMTRYNVDGTLDASFDGDGKLAPFYGAGGHSAQSVVVQSDGKIVVAGTSDDYYVLRRYHADGALDASFDGDGKVNTDVGFSGSVALQSDGKIIFAGTTGSVDAWDFELARYNADGTLDGSFDGGKIITDFQFSIDQCYGVAVQGDGKIVLAGSTRFDFEFASNDFALARYEGDPLTPPAFAGDYDRDLLVDGADFLLWQRQVGAVASPAGDGADGDRDGDVDQGDLDVWMDNFGGPPPAAAAALTNAPANVETSAVASEAPASAPGDATVDPLPSVASAAAAGAPTVRTWRPGLRPAWRDAGPVAAAHDDALAAWLAARSARRQLALTDVDFSAARGEPAFDAVSIDLDRGLELAFASLTARAMA